ncbi:RNA polymerase factor sigma-70 [Marinomonas mediterranea]|jgi:RNA polymerase sigma-70 factor, TIGR02943 family|uniref:RNA polymerase, sigma-24 subunit, ECF subfamily n=1 Tax=Marinomonas mediterranea (strain ATCC 700492 / JCM 21426 / NBRC 103028 / MMB-1) TaxID=717774 RepID=F2JW96_MARM1|nr:RNA polymerase factor sigma-70 [Marinomonas mediterranea]ADZ89484.1 RNA polymerase, sigma-24 subunit, ECF subfamily [Marinomonas mediterranea MMB-1]WCN07583.1 RNA polymerase factor sigma-70 [Marinomonas mediterranea]WCN11682.1 RNA polymerase factor sigma-70 [Marinomonas mediterranea]WCN15734.1 RNA polymerase factor sigma-70 [Marinomonas mediterranea MMB-1]
MESALSKNEGEFSSVGTFSDPVYMQELRNQMIKFARLQVRDEGLAEDAVQEAMLAAYQHIDRFTGKAAFKTWVFSILKNKLIDLLRKEKRHTAASQLEEGENLNGDALMDVLFAKNGHWNKSERPQKWDDPDHGVENNHFWRVFDACLNELPERYSRLFMMREFLEMETPEICENEAVTVSHLNVTLYRARLRLRECLEDCWYQSEAKQ